MTKAISKVVKPSKRLDFVELTAYRALIICDLLRDKAQFSWIQCATALGITENNLRTLRKNAKK